MDEYVQESLWRGKELAEGNTRLVSTSSGAHEALVLSATKGASRDASSAGGDQEQRSTDLGTIDDPAPDNACQDSLGRSWAGEKTT